MACSRKQGKVLCFCVALHGEGRSERREAAASAAEGEKMRRMVDGLQESNEGEVERERRPKRRELFVCLPPSSVSAAAAAASCPPNAYSPRGLVSRLLLLLHLPSPVRNGGGGGEEGLGCRVRFPRYCPNTRKGREKRGTEEVVVVVEKKGKVVVDVEEEEAAGGVSAVAASVQERSTELVVNSGKKSDELSLNLGMGVGLVFLLTRSATEINKMVELRQQMETLLKDVRDEFIHKKDVSSNHASSASNSYGNQNTTSYNSFQNDEPKDKTQLTCARDMRKSARRCLKMDHMEAELEVELERLQQRTADGKLSSLLPHQDRMELATEDADASESYGGSLSEAYEVYNEDNSIRYCGVSADELTRRLNQLLKTRQQEGIAELESSVNTENFSEDVNGVATEVDEEEDCSNLLERRLHELFETRQQERIAELESALECAERKLREKEREMSWWRDTATLVSQHKNNAVYR